MLKLLPLFALLASSAWCAATTVSDKIYNEIGGLANGTIYVTPNQQFKEVGGRQIYPVAIPAQVVNGILSIALYPNDTSLPTGTYYTASYSITNMAQISEIWIIPTSALPVDLDTIRAVNSPTTSFQVSLTQLLTTGCTNGQVLAFNGTSIACSSSGTGTVTHTLGTLTLNSLICGNGTGDVKTCDLSGNVTTSGSGVTTIAAAAVTNAMLAGSIAASKLVGSDIATVGTITAGTWTGTPINLALYSTGVLPAVSMPALTGDVTSSVGTVATTVAKIAGVTVSGTTGTTNVVFSGSPIIVTPTIASFVNATHNHTNAAAGGQITDAALSAAVTVPKGGTGVATLAAHGVVLGQGASNVAVSGAGVAGQCLTSNGASSDPTFQACGAGGGANLNLSNLSSVSINTTLLAQAGVSLGAAATPFTDLYLVGAGTYGTTSIHFSGTPTAARSVTTPDVSGVMLVGAALTSGNAVAADSTGNVVDFGFIPNTHTYEAGCTGTAASSVTGLNIQLWPSTNCSTTSATFEQLSVLAPVASKARNLRVRSNTNGAAAGSGVFTVFTRSGGATALTCTIGTGSTCSDTTHTVSVSAGEQLYVLFNTAGSETLQDINVVFEF